MVERVNFGTMGFNNQQYGDLEKLEQMPAYTPPPPRYNEGIQTLVNTYSPPSDLQQQAEAQRLRASLTNVPAQNLANQQASAFQNLLVNAGVIADPNPPVDTPPVDTPPVDEPPEDEIIIDPMDEVIEYNQNVQDILDNYNFYNQETIPNLPIVPNMPLAELPVRGVTPLGGQNFIPPTGLTGMPSGLETLLPDFTASTVVQDLEPTRPADNLATLAGGGMYNNSY
tara:strand:- start:11497 stop:12174 length:678 start_codon:yes stop_codon:yes gene_type:complete